MLWYRSVQRATGAQRKVFYPLPGGTSIFKAPVQKRGLLNGVPKGWSKVFTQRSVGTEQLKPKAQQSISKCCKMSYVLLRQTL